MTTGPTSLETRYLRLISVFPAAHRERYQSEMLDTLMEGARDGQVSPRPRETLDLLWNALWLRLRRDGTPATRDPRWADAAALFGPLAALTLATILCLVPLSRLAWEQRLGSPRLVALAMWRPMEDFPVWDLVAAGGWLAVAVIALARRRRIAAILATAGTLAHTTLLVSLSQENPALLVRQWPLVVFAATIAASLAWSRGGRPAWQTIGRTHLAIFGFTAPACAGSLWVDVMLADVRVDADGSGMQIGHFGVNWPLGPIDTVGIVPLACFLSFFGVLGWLLWRVGGGIRRRLLALLGVPVAMFFLTEAVYAGQWFGLVGLPLLIFGAGVLLVRRKDSQERSMELGPAGL